MTIRKDKKFKHAEAMRSISRPPSTLSDEVKKKIVNDFYNKSFPAASSKKLVASSSEPFYSDDYLDLMLSPEEVIDVQKQLNVGPMVRIKKPDLRKGLPNILLADASNKPPTLEDYLRLGMSLARLSDEERKMVQQMLDRSKPQEDK